ncbi:Pycsar system effector family protein [Micromonospora aurantiaca]|uniref:Pycsar system effector family protein n=1 Tax=Micromonospora aurantiaca (nom. illeg.) TaxID=47850 RepID=UPI003453CD36
MSRRQPASLRSNLARTRTEAPAKEDRAVPEQGKLNLESAWRAHTAQENWAAKVDTKASIFLAVDGVVLSAVLAGRNQQGNAFASLDGWRSDVLTLALVLCGLGGLLAIMVVFPVLGGRDPIRNSGTIYFGDLRRRQPAELSQQLANLTLDEHFRQVSRQLVAMARRTWIKHRLLQVALVSALTGFVAIMSVMLFG